MSGLRVIIAGGGTGGHIFPAVSIGKALQRLYPGTELLFVGALGKMEMEKVPQAGFEVVGLDIAGFNRSSIWKNITLPIKLFKSRMRAREIIKEFKPDAIVGVGGYASFPILYSGQALGIPTLIQEQNSYAGRSNKLLARKARAICVASKGMERFFPAQKIFFTGNPVRSNIAKMNKTQEQGRLHFGLKADLSTVLIVGGSLGAKSINEAVNEHIETILKEGVQVIWQTGTAYLQTAVERVKGREENVKVVDFIPEMEYAYAAADVVISRAGALAIAELCIAAKPVIFVPYPYAAENHQESNAMELVSHNAAMMVKDSDVKTELPGKLKVLLHDATMRAVMTKNLKARAITDADERIAEKVREIAGVN